MIKTTLLRSVSHDLRSPLTAITAAAGGLESPTVGGLRARGARLRDRDRERPPVAPGRQPARPLATAGGQRRAATATRYPVEELIEAAMESVPQPDGGLRRPARPAAAPGRTPMRPSWSGRSPTCSRTRPATRAAEAVSIRAARSGPLRDGAHLRPRPGHPAEELERIFEPFHRSTGRPGCRLGAGPAIARGFIEANGGHIRAESLPGQGTTFVIQLPVAGRRPAGTPTGDAAA